MSNVKETALNKIRAVAVNGNIESFGLYHQIPFIEIRNSNSIDYTLQIESRIEFSKNFNSPDSFSYEDNMMLFFNKINLCKIVHIDFIKEYFVIGFDNDLEMKILNDDEIGEAWKFFNSNKDGNSEYLSILCIDSEHFSIW